MFLKQISPELQAKAIAELNEVPSKIPEYLEKIKRWLKEQPHIEARTDDQWLIAFLRGCKYDIEATKRRLDRFYTAKTLSPKIFFNKDPLKPELQEMLKSGVCLPLPPFPGNADPHIWVLRLSLLKTDNIVEVVKYITMMCDICFFEEPHLSIGGGVLVVDLADMDINFLAENLVMWQKLEFYFNTCYPGRKQWVLYINAPPSFDKICEFMSNLKCNTKEQNERNEMYSEKDFLKLNEKVNLLNFPRDYDGNNLTLEELIDYWKNKFESYRNWFLEEENYKTNEKKRKGNPITDEIFYADIITETITTETHQKINI